MSTLSRSLVRAAMVGAGDAALRFAAACTCRCHWTSRTASLDPLPKKSCTNLMKPLLPLSSATSCPFYGLTRIFLCTAKRLSCYTFSFASVRVYSVRALPCLLRRAPRYLLLLSVC